LEKILKNNNFCKLFKVPNFDDNRGCVTNVSHIFDSMGLVAISNVKNIICVRSKRNVLRGLHFQKTLPQRKIIHLIKGEILDVTVDINPSSPNFLRPNYFQMETKKKNCLFVPENFLNGYRVISEEAIIQYYMDQPYFQENQISVKFDDEILAINWGGDGELIVSQKDKEGIDISKFVNLQGAEGN
jgi:dTDP-4-dehydrorhamnose 3,5-epimerase